MDCHTPAVSISDSASNLFGQESTAPAMLIRQGRETDTVMQRALQLSRMIQSMDIAIARGHFL
jgi:hypothetical protein